MVALPGFSRLIFLDVYQLPGLPLQAQRTLGGGLHWVETTALEGASGVRASTPMVGSSVLLILPAECSCSQRQPCSIGGFLLLKKMYFPPLSKELNFYNNKWNSSMLNKSPGLEVGQSILVPSLFLLEILCKQTYQEL